MGKMLDALKRAEHASGELEERLTATPSKDNLLSTEPPSESDEEIPFIEVGPHKSMEASRSVLASASVAIPHSLRIEPQPAAPSPRKVQFRALPDPREKQSHLAPELVAYHAPQESEAQQYRVVLEAVRNASASREGSAVLLFTAIRAGTGNTTTLLNLAITAAREGRERVLVVDADPRHPAVADRLGLPASPGLREALAGTIALDRAVQPTEQANLFALTTGPSNPQSDNWPRFLAQTMRSLLRQLRSRFPLVFVDGPPREGRSEGMMLDSACDATFLVLPEREAETAQIEELFQLLPYHGGHLAGCILVAGRARSS